MKRLTIFKRNLLRAAALLLALLTAALLPSCTVSDLYERPTESGTVLLSPNQSGGGEEGKTSIKNVILIIGDGMGLEHINAAQLCTGNRFRFTGWQYFSVDSDSVDANGKGAILTDSAASGTALATGHLTVNGYVGKSYAGDDVSTLLDEAGMLGKATGIVTTDALYGATPAAFSAHAYSRDDHAGIIASQLSSGVDLLCGNADALCTDQRAAIEAAGYLYCDSLAAASNSIDAAQAYWQLSLEGTQAAVKLCDATLLALEFLSRDEDGFCLMVEQAHIDKYSHSNSIAEVIQCVSDLNDTVNTVLTWLGDRTDTAIIVTADHETGGLSVSSRDRFASTYDGEGGRIYYEFSSTDHTVAYVGVFVFGVQVDPKSYSYKSSYLVKNADVYHIACDLLHQRTAP